VVHQRADVAAQKHHSHEKRPTQSKHLLILLS
jgi:hypothetical protein